MSEPPSVSLVIPAHNEEEVLERCLASAVPLMADNQVAEILVVDDASTDRTAEIIRSFPQVTYVSGDGGGAGSARNLGFARAQHPLIWFVDADCVIEPDALSFLRPHMDDPEVGGVSGSYGNMNEHAWLSSVIHEEIVQRHLRMDVEVNFLATFNVLYRRDILELVGGFDSTFRKAQDAELSYRVRAAGYKLHFELRSRVRHFHEDSLLRYLQVQRQQGYYRIKMYERHPEKMAGDSYSGFLDHVQPPLAVLSASLPFLGPAAIAAPLAWVALCGAPLPMTLRLLARTGDIRQLGYLPLSVIRSYARGAGLCEGVLDVVRNKIRRLGKPTAGEPS